MYQFIHKDHLNIQNFNLEFTKQLSKRWRCMWSLNTWQNKDIQTYKGESYTNKKEVNMNLSAKFDTQKFNRIVIFSGWKSFGWLGKKMIFQHAAPPRVSVENIVLSYYYQLHQLIQNVLKLTMWLNAQIHLLFLQTIPHHFIGEKPFRPFTYAMHVKLTFPHITLSMDLVVEELLCFSFSIFGK